MSSTTTLCNVRTTRVLRVGGMTDFGTQYSPRPPPRAIPRRRKYLTSFQGPCPARQTFLFRCGVTVRRQPVQVALLDQAADRQGAAIASRKASKCRTHVDACHTQGIRFVPLVVETFGGWDPEVVLVPREMASSACGEPAVTVVPSHGTSFNASPLCSTERMLASSS
jgi:hypothetical protein